MIFGLPHILARGGWRPACVMRGMTKIPSYSEREALANMIGKLVQGSLAHSEHWSALSATSTGLISSGTQFASNAGVAFAIVVQLPWTPPVNGPRWRWPPAIGVMSQRHLIGTAVVQRSEARHI
jgi:hypothetical protein